MSIEVSCPGGGALTGTFSLNTSSGALSGTNATPAAAVMHVPADKTIYIAIAPGEKNNFTVNWDDGNGDHARKRKNSAVTFEAGKIYDLGNTSAWND
jgi:hypothetical protein